MIQEAIRTLTERRNLTVAESAQAMEEIMTGAATPAQIAAFVVALRMKGETADEITGCAMVMRQKARHIKASAGRYDVVDTCGTGGDTRNTFNISTAAALVAAGAGVTVAKHGNRAATSRCGSADVLKLLGVKVDADPRVAERCLRETRIGFLFAPLLHEAMRFAGGPREIGVRTVFNILGPLTNPAGAPCQVLGVFDASLASLMAHVLKALGSKRCMVVHGDDGLDEITTTGSTFVAELHQGEVKTYNLTPEDVGLPRSRLSDLVVSDADEAVRALQSVLNGDSGPRRDIVVFNAAAALLVAGAAKDLREGVHKAQATIDSGAARQTLETLVRISNEPLTD